MDGRLVNSKDIRIDEYKGWQPMLFLRAYCSFQIRQHILNCSSSKYRRPGNLNVLNVEASECEILMSKLKFRDPINHAILMLHATSYIVICGQCGSFRRVVQMKCMEVENCTRSKWLLPLPSSRVPNNDTTWFFDVHSYSRNVAITVVGEAG